MDRGAEVTELWTFPATWSALGEAQVAVETYCADAGCPVPIQLKLSLAIDELFSNTIKHGYGSETNHLVKVGVEVHAKVIVLYYADQARRYDPLTDPPRPDFTLPVEDRPVGGLGAHLVRKISDHSEYEREGDWNRVILHFNLLQQPA
ncbi:MAG: ATP-binding protein [Magnetospiraceae bacterium]